MQICIKCRNAEMQKCSRLRIGHQSIEMSRIFFCAKVLKMSEKEMWHGEDDNLDFNVAENRRWNGDAKGKPLRYQVRSRIMQLLDMQVMDTKTGKMKNKFTHQEIAETMNVHKRTVSNYNKARKDQNLTKATAIGPDKQVREYTVGVPAPGKQGGFRWSRFSEEQQEACIRISLENPRDTITQIKEKVQDLYPHLKVSDSTVWRTLNNAGLSYLRAQMKDPLGEGELATNAKNEEMKAFITEQQKGERGALNPINMFFMDETSVTLNEVPSKGWGSKDDVPVFEKSKGKTLTINLYAGLGLVQDAKNDMYQKNLPEISCTIDDTQPRGNHLKFNYQEKCWETQPEQPKFALFWWIRPPTRSGTAISSFLNEKDVVSSTFTLFDPTRLDENTAKNCSTGDADLDCGFFRPALTRPLPIFNRHIATIEHVSLQDLTDVRLLKLSDESVFVVVKDCLLSVKDLNNQDIPVGLHMLTNGPTKKLVLDDKEIVVSDIDVLKFTEQSTDDELFVECTRTTSSSATVIPYPFVWKDHLKSLIPDQYLSFNGYTFQNKMRKNTEHVIALDQFLHFDLGPRQYNIANMQQLLWLNGVEYRQVDQEDASLIKIDGKHITLGLEQMVNLYKDLQNLIRNALKIDTSTYYDNVPRAYYTPTGKSFKGGKLDSDYKRGDRSLFVKYLLETTNYVEKVFGPETRKNLSIAFDSAPQHGKVDVDSKHVSYIHDWVKKQLDIKEAIFLPVKAPDYNPAEMLFAFIKSNIRLKQRSFTGEVSATRMIELIDQAFQGVTLSMVQGWVRYSCFRIPGDNTPLDQKRCMNKIEELQIQSRPSTLLELRLDEWRQNFLQKYSQDTNELLQNGEFIVEVLSIIKNQENNLEAYTNLIDSLILFKNEDELKNEFYDIDVKEPTVKSYDGFTKIIANTLCFNNTYDGIVDLKFDEKHNFLYVKRPAHDRYFKYRVKTSNASQTADLPFIDTDKYVLTTTDTKFNKDTVIQIKIRNKDVKIKNECELHLEHNFKVDEFKEFVDILADCTSEINFPCFSQLIKTKSLHLENHAKLHKLIDLINEHLLEAHSPINDLNKCKQYAFDVSNRLASSIDSIDDRIKHVLDAYEPFVAKSDLVEISKPGNRLVVTKNGISRYTESLSEPDFNKIGISYRVSKSRKSYFEIQADGKTVRFQNPTSLDKELPSDMVRNILQSTPYKICLPPKDDEFESLGIALIILKALKHERSVITDVNDMLCKAIEHELAKDTVNFSQIFATCEDCLKKLQRKCDKCDTKSKFKRFPFFSVEKFREKNLQEKEMKRRAMGKQPGERRWPGYPVLTEEEMNEYKERGSGPDFEVIVNDDNTRVMNNEIEAIEIDENNPKKVKITVRGQTKELNEDDEKDKTQWNLYFGPFAQENQIKLEHERQRMKENIAKLNKLQKLENVPTPRSIGRVETNVVSPNGKILGLKSITSALMKKIKSKLDEETYLKKHACVYDEKTGRIYPPKDVSFQNLSKGIEEFHLLLADPDPENMWGKNVKVIVNPQTIEPILVSYKKIGYLWKKLEQRPTLVHHNTTNELFDLLAPLEKADVYTLDKRFKSISGLKHNDIVESNNHFYQAIGKTFHEFGFTHTMFKPYPRKMLGLDIKLNNLYEKGKFYYVELENFQDFFRDIYPDDTNFESNHFIKVTIDSNDAFIPIQGKKIIIGKEKFNKVQEELTLLTPNLDAKEQLFKEFASISAENKSAYMLKLTAENRSSLKFAAAAA